MKKILIKGAGEMASATAHRLFKCGFQVVMTEIDQPTSVRLNVAFCTAVYEGEWEVEGVKSHLYALKDSIKLNNLDWQHIPVFIDSEGELIRLWQPDIIIDARLLKYNRDNKITDAPLTIGLGPGLKAGRDVHYVIETMRGHNLARIIEVGYAMANTGIPGNITGVTKERVIKAPIAGTFKAIKKICDIVEAGETVALIEQTPVKAEIKGVLRGLIHSDIQVSEGLKLGDIDPRTDIDFCFTISDKARNISGSVLELVCRFGK